MKNLYLERDMNSQVAILYATVRDTFKRLQNLVEGTEKVELSFKGAENNENSIGQLLIQRIPAPYNLNVSVKSPLINGLGGVCLKVAFFLLSPSYH